MGEYIAIGVGVVINLVSLAYFLGGLKEKVHGHGGRIRRLEQAVWPLHTSHEGETE